MPPVGEFKKDNKELLTYLLFESVDETTYIENIKETVPRPVAERQTGGDASAKDGVRNWSESEFGIEISL